ARPRGAACRWSGADLRRPGTRRAGHRGPRLPDVPGTAWRARRLPARTGRGPRNGAGAGRHRAGRPEVGGADGAVQPAWQRGGLRLDGNPDVHGRARAGALISLLHASTSPQGFSNATDPGWG